VNGNPAPAPDSARPRDTKPDAREHWQRVWQDNYEALTERLLAATEAEKTQYGVCSHCGRKTPIQHPDTRARTDAISKLHELAGLRPRPDDGTMVTAPAVIRRVVLPEGREVEGGESGAAVSVQD
jgi:hypothetical protein